MSRRPGLFRQSDLVRALRAARAAGVEVDRVEIDRDGKLVIVVAGKAAKEPPGSNEWDEVLK
jgi:hypothetical protein